LHELLFKGRFDGLLGRTNRVHFIPAFYYTAPLALAVKDCVFQDSYAQLATTCNTYLTIQLNFWARQTISPIS